MVTLQTFTRDKAGSRSEPKQNIAIITIFEEKKWDLPRERDEEGVEERDVSMKESVARLNL
jgi:hypothetical protein